MGFDRRFTAGLLGWIALLLLAAGGFAWSLQQPGLAAARLLGGAWVLGVGWGLWRHVSQTNRMVAQFVSALRHQDFALRFAGAPDGGSFGDLAGALNEAVGRLRVERDATLQQLRFLEALVDDVPVALLTVDVGGDVTLANKAARRLFATVEGPRPEHFAPFGESFAAHLAAGAPGTGELMLLRLPTGLERAIVRTARLDRLGLPVRAVAVQPIRSTIDAIEMAAQTDLVRVLTHEILNSLTPVTSLSATAADAIAADPPDLEGARLAMRTLTRRAEGLRSFIHSYRAVARAPELRPRPFLAEPLAHEMARLVRAEWPEMKLAVAVSPGLELEGDPDLVAQALLNLLRNGAQAAACTEGEPWLELAVEHGEEGHTRITVRDNGGGVPAELRRDVFLPFFTTRAEGTGVGLNLVRQIVTAHGWTIDIADRPGGGAEFRITC